MAINYTISDAVKVIADNAEPEKIMDIGKRFPLLLNAVVRCAAKAGTDFVEFMQYVPEYVTANKINQAMKREVGDDEPEEEPEGEAPKAAKPGPKPRAEKAEDEEEAAEKPKRGRGRPRKNPVPEQQQLPDADDADESEEETPAPYADMTAPELYKLCRQREIEAMPKKPAKYYVDLLVKFDEGGFDKKADEEEADDDDDDWDI